jgi:Zn-dependent peptidase ImmA (M78 family)/DNA-binding XRE family transcriptional regulator
MTSPTISVKPELLRWARERASLDQTELARRVGLKPDRVTSWEQSGQLSLAHLERVAEKTQTPVGYLFLPVPPEEKLPIPDFRTPDGERVSRPSPNLLDTIYQCQHRQEWFRDYLVTEGERPLSFVASATMLVPARELAHRIQAEIRFDTEARASLPTWAEALRDLVQRIEAAGVLVMRNGVVGNNTHRKLNVAEFRGFALSDPYAPLIFVNAADTRAAQQFTLAHELAHLWLGQTGVSDPSIRPSNAAERYANAVAAELLVPLDEFRQRWNRQADPTSQLQPLARHFKVSTLVVLIRALEAEAISRESFDVLDQAERARLKEVSGAGGGDFYRTQGSRLGSRFAQAVIASTLEGRTLYRDAFRLLGIKKAETFQKLAESLGVPPA